MENKMQKIINNNFEKPKGSTRFMIILILFIAVGMFANYMYIPSLPVIAHDLLASNGAIATTVTAALVGCGISQLFYGPISDSYGRKKTLIAGLLIICIGSIIACTSHSLDQLLIARFVMGLGLGSASVLYRIMLKDFFPHSSLGWAVSTMTTFTALLPAISPFLGGLVLIAFTWRMLFIFLLSYTVVVIFLILKLLPETHKKEDRIPLKITLIIKSYRSLLKNKRYVISVICIVFSYACLALYITATPFIYQDQFHLSPAVFGTLIIIPTLAFVLGGKISSVINTKNIKLKKVIIFGVLIIICACLFLTFSDVFHINNYVVTTILITIEALGISLAYINATAVMLHNLPKTSGPGVALSGGLQMAITGVIIYLATFIHIDSAFALGMSSIICALVIAAALLCLGKKSSAVK